MKKILISSTFILASLIATTTLISCEKQTTSALPEFTGEIKLDRTRIGQGQKLTASYTIPTGGSNIESGTIYWNCDDNQIPAKPTEKDGVSTINFIADYKPGDHTIEFVRQYLNFDMAASQSKSIKGKFTIVECDVLTSFWNDSKVAVMATANEKFQNDTEPLSAIGKNILGQDTEIRQYFFGGDKLNKVVVTPLQTASVGKSVAYIAAHSLRFERDGYTRNSYDVVNMATGVKTPIDTNKLTDIAYTGPISTDVENGKSELLIVLQNNKNTINMSYKMGATGLIINNITYLPR